MKNKIPTNIWIAIMLFFGSLYAFYYEGYIVAGFLHLLGWFCLFSDKLNKKQIEKLQKIGIVIAIIVIIIFVVLMILDIFGIGGF